LNRRIISIILILVLLTSIFSVLPTCVGGWSNGGYSDNPSSPDYGTHDWIAQHALEWLPIEEKQYILDNFNSYLYGTELPDNSGPEDGIGDTATHHIYYNRNGELTDDSSASRAAVEYSHAKSHLVNKNYVDASKYAGIMSHYIVDVGVFGHVMGKNTDWGAEVHHSDYENYVTAQMGEYNSTEFDGYLVFDGNLDTKSAYDAAIELAYYTTFGDGNNIRNCTWMDDFYSWDNNVFKGSCGASLNYSVNYLTDVLHTLAVESGYDGEGGTHNITPKIVFSEIYYDAEGVDADNEYIELYNPTEVMIDISNWKIKDNTAQYTITGPMNLLPYSYFTLSRNGSAFLSEYGYSPDKGDLSLALSNEGDNLTLYDNIGGEIDFVSWEGEALGWNIYANEGKVINRDDPDIDTDESDDWNSDQTRNPKTQASGSFPPPENQPPVADIIVSKYIVNISEEITFDASDSYDPDGDTISYYWDFDEIDGIEEDDTGVIVTHNYSIIRTYIVTLTVVDAEGAIDTYTHPIDVAVPNQPPTPSVTADPMTGEAPLEVVFGGTFGDPELEETTWIYNFSDGSPDDFKIPMYHTFQNPGIYNVTFTVTDVHGAVGTDYVIINVTAPIPDDNGGNGDTNDSQDDGNLTDDKEGSDDYYWVYGLCGIMAIIVAIIILIVAIKRIKK
jgi:PKD repeat protein